MKTIEVGSVGYRVFVLSLALFLSVLLFSAAFGKIIFPNPSLDRIDSLAGYFEILMAALILVYYPYGRVWAIIGAMFAAWGGYALFWAIRGLPCSCLGQAFLLPPALFVVLDAGIFAAAAAIVRRQSLRKRIFRNFISASSLVFVLGFFVGPVVLKYFVEM